MVSPVMGPESVGGVLKRRGVTIETRGSIQDILLPLDRELPLSGEQCNEFRRLFSKSSFRKVIRQITSESGNATVEQLTKIAGDQTDSYIGFLSSIGVAERSGSRVMLTRPINYIGPTLEWYVADVFKKDFAGSAEWSVNLSDFRYGDYDVLAWLPPILIYVETKSSRPSEVNESELRHFLQRGVELAPDLAILLIDTEDDLEKADLIRRLFDLMLLTVRTNNGIAAPEWQHDEKPFITPQARYPGISFGYRRFYVTNSEPSIRSQLSKCLRHYHSAVKGMNFYGGDSVNFVPES
jgi:hypothetical protein